MSARAERSARRIIRKLAGTDGHLLYADRQTLAKEYQIAGRKFDAAIADLQKLHHLTLHALRHEYCQLPAGLALIIQREAQRLVAEHGDRAVLALHRETTLKMAAITEAYHVKCGWLDQCALRSRKLAGKYHL